MASMAAYTRSVIREGHFEKMRGITCDLRSDTVTKPDQPMLEAMMKAEVGDDVMGDDPTVVELETRVAGLCGKEAGLYVATGTMSNQLAVRSCVGALQSVVCDRRCHINQFECGGVAYHSQAALIEVDPLPGKFNLTVEAIEPLMMGPDIHHAETKLILLENTMGGHVFPLEEMQRIKQFAESRGVLVHMDGARLWNASAATGISLLEYAKCADSVSLCLSKTLGAPVGSVLVGTKEFINRARLFRKVFGGGWRQAGVLAAAGLYAIDNIFPMLQEVHQRAKYLGSSLTDLGFVVNADVGGAIDTNMLFVDIKPVMAKTGLDWAAVAKHLEDEHIKIAGPRGDQTTVNRLVVHHQASLKELERLVALVGKMVKSEC